MESGLSLIVSVCLFIVYNTFNPTSWSFDCLNGIRQINMQRDVNHSVVDNFKHICVSPKGMHSLRPVFTAKHASVPCESVFYADDLSRQMLHKLHVNLF